MLNVLSYAGMNLQAEVCLWTLVGILRTVFDATLFKVNANLKQVWQMTMPAELSMPVQRVLRTMISGIMLVQCFTVYVYLATYIVLLYPVFLEERPTLVLPWLLLAAIRKLLCELLSLALGLGTCLLIGPARPPCIKFVVVKIISIMPSFYMWMLVFSYYHALKIAAALHTFPAAPAHDLDYGLELAIRRRRTKSLFNESMLRTRLITNLYSDNTATSAKTVLPRDTCNASQSEVSAASEAQSSEAKKTKDKSDAAGNQNKWDLSEGCQTSTYRLPSDLRTSEDWYVGELTIPRDTDRITEQLCLMLLRISIYLRMKENGQDLIFGSGSFVHFPKSIDNLNCPHLTDEPATPPLTTSSKGNVASYLRDYPQIFMRKTSDLQLELKLDTIQKVRSQIESDTETLKVTRQILASESDENFRLGENKFHKRITILEEAALKQQASFESYYSKQLQTLREANLDKKEHKEDPQSNQEKKANTDMTASSSDSLSNIIARMKSQLKEATSSRTATPSHTLYYSSSDLSNGNSKNDNGNTKDKKN